MKNTPQNNEDPNLKSTVLADVLSVYANEVNDIIDSIGVENTAKKRGWAKIKLLGIISNAHNSNALSLDIITRLDQVIVDCEKNEKSFEENGMEYMSITSGAMGQAYRITRGWLQNIR